MTGAYFNNYQIFCVGANEAPVTGDCTYLVTPTCPDSSCSDLSYTLDSGQWAIVNAQGQILDTANPLPNEFGIAIGGTGFVNQTSMIKKRKVKSITSVCPSDRQPKQVLVLFENVQCDTEYCLSFTINSPMANSWVPGHTVQTSTVKTSCCPGCDTEGSAIELAKLFAKDINSGAFCGGIKNRFIKATAICTGDQLTVDIEDNTTCVTGDCPGSVTVEHTYQAGVLIEGLFYDEYAASCGVPARRDVRWNGTNFEVKMGGLKEAGSLAHCGWNCNYKVIKVQDLAYETGNGCWMRRDQREANRNFINPLTQEWSTYDFPAQHADLGQINCNCGTSYCVYEIVVEQNLSYSNGQEDLHIIIGFPADNTTASTAFATLLEDNFDVELNLDTCYEGSTSVSVLNHSNPTE